MNAFELGTSIDSLPFVDGKPTLCAAFYVTLYFEDGHLEEKRQACIDLFEDYSKMGGEAFKWRWCTDPKSHRWRRFAPDYHPRCWHLELQGNVWQYCYHSGETYDNCAPWRICAFGYPLSAPGHKLSYFNAAWPVSWLTDFSSSKVATFVENWCARLQPLHGSGGICVLSPLDTTREAQMAPHVRGLAERFPGVEVDYPASHALYLQDGIKGVNWLTCLGERWIAKLGGVSNLKSALSEELTLHEYAGGVLIQAGAMPQIGDACLPQYRRMSRLLKPVRVQDHGAFPGFDKEATRAWFNRFD
ncbi:type VI immunity family protein [Bradyrhizobium sp. UFLA05-153]